MTWTDPPERTKWTASSKAAAQFGCIAEPPVDAQLVKDEGHIDECLPIRLFSYSTFAQLQGATDSMSIRDLVSDL